MAKEKKLEAAFVFIWRRGLAGKKALAMRPAMDLGMVTGVGGMWRRCITSSDGRLERDIAIRPLRLYSLKEGVQNS